MGDLEKFHVLNLYIFIRPIVVIKLEFEDFAIFLDESYFPNYFVDFIEDSDVVIPQFVNTLPIVLVEFVIVEDKLVVVFVEAESLEFGLL